MKTIWSGCITLPLIWCSNWSGWKSITGGERIARHNHLRDAIFDTAAAAGLGPVKEGRFLLPGCYRRPADVLLHNWAQGRDAALDVTVVTPIRQDLVVAAATNPGYALSFKYNEKLNGAEELCRRQGIAFFPLAAETFGGWHRVGEREIKKLVETTVAQPMYFV